MSLASDAAAQQDPPGRGIVVDLPIRWGDMDALAHVNNTVFFQFCESARMAYFEAMGLDRFKARPTDGPGLVTATLNFRRQLRYPGAVRVSVNITAVTRRSFTLDYVIRDLSHGEISADGSSVCVWVDYVEQKAILLPDGLIERIVEMEQNPELRRRGSS